MFNCKGPWSVAMVPEGLLIYHCAPKKKKRKRHLYGFLCTVIHGQCVKLWQVLTWVAVLFAPAVICQALFFLTPFCIPAWNRKSKRSRSTVLRLTTRLPLLQQGGIKSAKSQTGSRVSRGQAPTVCLRVDSWLLHSSTINHSIFFHVRSAKHGCSLPILIFAHLLKLPHFNLQLSKTAYSQ